MWSAEFVVAFFASKHVTLLTAFVCWPPGALHSLHSAAARSGARVRAVPPTAPLPPLAPDGVRREGVLLDAACAHAHDVIHQASNSRAFNHRHSWLVLEVGGGNSSARAQLAAAAVLPDADLTLASAGQLVDLYRVKEDEPMIETRWEVDTNWSSSQLASYWARQPTTTARRRHLGGVRVRSTVIVSQPQHFRGWSELAERQIDTFPKVTYPIMMLLAEDLHFRYNMRQTDSYGEERNGSFDGLAGQLQRREAELGVASMFMRADRWRVLHYAAETVVLRGSFVFRQPVQAAVTNVFVLPFSRGVWAAAAALVTSSAALLAVLAHTAAGVDPTLDRITPAETFTFALGTICQQGFHVTPALVSARLVMFSSLLLALFSFTAYSAKIVSILQAPSDALRTIDDLERSSIQVAVQETTYKKVYFAESRDPATQRLYRKKLLPLGERAYMSVVDGIARVRTQFFAFQVEESPGYEVISRTFTEREKCSLQQIKAFELPMVSVPIAKHSGLRELVAGRLRWQREVGLMERARRVWLAARPRCNHAARAGGFTSVGLTDVLPTVQVLGIGAALSAAILVAECLYVRLRHYRNQ